MAFKIAIASGKGGTGKTIVSINMNKYLRMNNHQVLLVDCDVEEPNDHLFFTKTEITHQEPIYKMVPQIDTQACTFCGKCADYCEFNAILLIPSVKFSKVDTGLCHSCGACVFACQDNAITEVPEPIGEVTFYNATEGSRLAEGRLKIGSAMQTSLIKELKKQVGQQENELVLFDAPPGTSCPVVETISDSDYVVLVAEPTLFGLYDLKLMVALLKELHLPFGLVINKAGLGDNEIYTYAKAESIDIIGEIPFSKSYASIYANGQIMGEIPAEIDQAYQKLVRHLEGTINTLSTTIHL